MPEPRPRVLAIISTHNEEDVIGYVVRDAIRQGIDVYVLDDGSTDGTLEEVRPLVGAGVVGIEPTAAARQGDPHYRWDAILARKVELARELDYDWYIHADADELREGPWRGLEIPESLAIVDRLGYNAVDFVVLNFWPTHDGYRKGDDLRAAFPRYARAEELDREQVRCWKRTGAEVALLRGGHDAAFEGRRIFPVRFLLRHYPVRSRAHGERKVHQERQARYDPAERARGWHRQYDAFTAGASFLRDEASMTLFDAERVRLELWLDHREVEALRERVERLAVEERRIAAELEAVTADRRLVDEDRQHWQRVCGESQQDAAALRAAADALHVEGEALRAQVDALREELAERRGESARLASRVADLEASWSWRLTAPARALLRALGRG